MGDIRKMFRSIHLKALEQHCHWLLWRDLQTDQKPDVYIMTRVNMGDTPAPAISTEAVYAKRGRKRGRKVIEKEMRCCKLLTLRQF